MKKRVWLVLVMIVALLAACQSQTPAISQNTPGAPPAPVAEKTEVPPPADNTTGTVTGRIVSTADGKPYANTIVWLASVHRNGESAAFALDTAHSPARYTDEDGYFVIPGVTYPEFVIVVGDPETKYYIVQNSDDSARVFQTKMGEILQIGELKIDFVP